MTTKQKRDRDNASRIPRRLRQVLPIEQCAGCEHNETIRCKRFEKPAMEWARPGGCRCYMAEEPK